MGQTRFVVEVREPVPDERVGEAAASIAARFAMDVRRVRTLLEDRTGPVTKPLAKDKADRVAQVFRDAGVVVAVESRPQEASAGSGTLVASGEDAPEADAERSPGSGRVGPPTSRSPVSVAPPPVSDGPDGVVEPAHEAGTGPSGTAGDTVLSSTRWVHSPHEEPESAVAGASQEAGAGSGDGASGDRAPGAGTPGAGNPAAEPQPTRAAGTGRSAGRILPDLGIRGYLVVALAVALVLLLVLQAVNRGHPAGQPAAGMDAGTAAYAAGDFARARRVWLPLAENGDARAQYMLGYMAENGQGRAWSNHDAAGWYRRAASQSYPQAQVALGRLYQRGMGVTRDPEEAAGLYRAAAEEGYGPGQFQYALAYFHGSGVPQDFAAALKWFEAAAANGVAEARPYVAFAGSGSAAGGESAGRSGDAGGQRTEASSPGPGAGEVH